MSSRKRKRKRSHVDEEATLAALQTRSHQIATTWHEGIDLQYLGVNLGQCLNYSMIQNVNNAILNTMRGHND